MDGEKYFNENCEKYKHSENSEYIDVTALKNRINKNIEKTIESSTRECIDNISNIMKNLSSHIINK